MCIATATGGLANISRSRCLSLGGHGGTHSISHKYEQLISCVAGTKNFSQGPMSYSFDRDIVTLKQVLLGLASILELFD